MSVLAQPVFAGGRTRAFGELDRAEVAGRAAELRSLSGFGPTARVVPVAMAWAELARVMREHGARTVADLDRDVVERYAERLWVVPPGGSLLG